MKLLFTLLLTLFFALPAHAQGNGIAMLIIDKDPGGTNVREEPKGRVMRVIPYGGKTDEEKEMRRVQVTEEKGQWFLVRLADDASGWMHASVLGACASATEDGDPSMYAEPNEESALIARVKDGTPLRLLDIRFPNDRGGWARMEYTTPSGNKQTGWMMEHTLLANPYNDCWSQ
ncbi:SH3 domain-containing protein [Desulfovibrio sp. OttesenSCG-928-M16]|nr:SH3 domain-containing protein [Desulfovibrio sp. OttesenSCG-928-M16]